MSLTDGRNEQIGLADGATPRQEEGSESGSLVVGFSIEREQCQAVHQRTRPLEISPPETVGSQEHFRGRRGGYKLSLGAQVKLPPPTDGICVAVE